MTICETFRAADRHVVVLRYDGARRRGESFHEEGLRGGPQPDAQATLSQGAIDLRGAIEYARNNSRFHAESIAIVTFSLFLGGSTAAAAQSGSARLACATGWWRWAWPICPTRSSSRQVA